MSGVPRSEEYELTIKPGNSVATKKCRKCGIDKTLGEFAKRGKLPSSRCKKCTNKVHRAWKKARPDLTKARKKRYQLKNPKKVYEGNKRWAKRHPEKRNEYSKRRRDKIKNTLSYKLKSSISSRLWSLLRGAKASRTWTELVGYSVEDLRGHLEKKFKPGMSWNNYGEWVIDHIIPVSVFNFSYPNDIDFKKCWSLNNLQPLWRAENSSKNNKLSKPFQPCLNLRIIT